jgi:peroxiredoxin
MLKKTVKYFSIVFLIVGSVIFSSSFKSFIGSTVTDFTLLNVDGKMFATSDFKNAKGFIVIFTCNHCPFAKLYSKRLNDLSKKYARLNVPLIAINSMDSLIYAEETFSEMKTKAKTDHFQFPYLQDTKQQVGKLFKAEHTPTAFIIWKENQLWKIKYKGAIDDNGENPGLAKPFVANAVDELIQGKPVSLPQTQSFGCSIFYRK